jgi:hypothetical protein
VAVIRSARIPVFWGIAGFAVGLIIASQLAWPALNFDLPWTTFGRLRPLHTSAIIFAFGGNVLIATSFYVVQKTCRTRPNVRKSRRRAVTRTAASASAGDSSRHYCFNDAHAYMLISSPTATSMILGAFQAMLSSLI